MFSIILTLSLFTSAEIKPEKLESKPKLGLKEKKLIDFAGKKPEVKVPQSNLSGVYSVTGTAQTATGHKKIYKSIVTFAKSNAPVEMYVVNWLTGSNHFTGRALRVGNKISLSWPVGDSIGTSLLIINADGTFSGHWVSKSAVGTEVFVPVKMPDNWRNFGKKVRDLEKDK